MKLKMKMLVATLTLAAIASLGIATATAKPKDDKPVAELPKCPVMDEPVDFRISTMTNEGPVYFCCKMCAGKFKKDPKKYASKTKTQRAALAERDRVQVTCPISGEPIDKDVHVGEGDERVYFCCGKCKSKYEAAPDKFTAKLAASYTYQTRCPIMGGKISPKSHMKLASGETVYFCCPGCDKKLLKEPAKYVKNLNKQGYGFDEKDIKKPKNP